jgi:5-(carboxyamino)imidazole ribonucleotide synthase
MYFVHAARALGARTVVLEPDVDSPAGLVADEHIVADYDDEAALARLATACGAVTVEFENPPVNSLHFLERHTTVYPGADAVAIAQDRRAEKEFCGRHGWKTAPFRVIDSPEALQHLMEDATLDALLADGAILKTARLGYDGKGQRVVANRDELHTFWNELGKVPCVLEQRLVLDSELSVIVARDPSGSLLTYPATRNEHMNGILSVSVAPVTGSHAQRATRIAVDVATALGYVGVMAVEFFVVGDEVLVNELAPRPHNSGHWTLDAAETSQFEQQARILLGMPLGPTTMTSPAVAMANLLGDMWSHGEPHWECITSDHAAQLHLYGKRSSRPGRKMGHLTVCGANSVDVERRVRELRAAATADLSDGSDGAR